MDAPVVAGTAMQLDELQKQVDGWIRNVAGGYWSPFQILARLTEELGEVASALQRQEGLRPRKSTSNVEEEVGDLLFPLAAFANASGIRLEDALSKVMAKYESRDGPAWRSSDGGLQP